MKLCRLLLIASVVLTGYCAVQLATVAPWLVIGAGVVLCVAAAKRGYGRLTTLGSARWADGDDLRRAGMLDAPNGLSLGRITEFLASSRSSKPARIRAW